MTSAEPTATAPGDAPVLPLTWRPRRGRTVALAMAALVLAGGGGLAWALNGPHVHLGDRIGIAALAVPVAAVLGLLARPVLRADDAGLTVVNLVRTHHLAWAEVVGIGVAETESWASLDLADGSTLAVLALQTADGARYRRRVQELRALVAARAGGEPPLLGDPA